MSQVNNANCGVHFLGSSVVPTFNIKASGLFGEMLPSGVPQSAQKKRFTGSVRSVRLNVAGLPLTKVNLCCGKT